MASYARLGRTGRRRFWWTTGRRPGPTGKPAFLGDPGVDTDFVTTPGAGTVELDNFSYLSDTALDALQGDSFLLATLTFSGIAVGTSGLDLTLLDISDAAGTTITPTVGVANGTLEVQSTGGTAPTPPTYLLMLPVLLAGAVKLRRKS